MGGGGLKGGCRVYGGLNGMMRGCRLVSFSATAFSGCLDFLRVHVDMPADVAVFVLVEHLLPLVERVVQGFAAGAFQEDLGALRFRRAPLVPTLASARQTAARGHGSRWKTASRRR